MRTSTKSLEVDQFIKEKAALTKIKQHDLISGKRSFSDCRPQIFAISIAIAVCVFFGSRGDLSPGVAISIGSIAVALIIYIRIESILITRQIIELKALLEKEK
jgi:hypothetical protein